MSQNIQKQFQDNSIDSSNFLAFNKYIWSIPEFVV